jgi:DNA-binding IclR family transcriptional regulator
MRYSELKKATGLPSGTLDRRLSELIKIRLVRQKTHMTPSGRYRLIYEVVDGAREMLIGIQMYIAEAELEKRYRKIIDATDLTDEGKECAKREFHKRFSLISDAIATVFFQSYAIGKKSEKR